MVYNFTLDNTDYEADIEVIGSYKPAVLTLKNGDPGFPMEVPEMFVSEIREGSSSDPLTGEELERVKDYLYSQETAVLESLEGDYV